MKESIRNAIIVSCLKRKTFIVDSNKFEQTQLFGNEYFYQRPDSLTFEINLDSKKNRSSILALAEKKLGRTLPLNISDSLKFVYEFEEELKMPESNVTWAGLIELRQALAGFCLAKIHKEGHENLLEFVLTGKKEKQQAHLRNIETYFFEALLDIHMNPKELLSTIRSYNTSTELGHTVNKSITFVRKLGERKVNVAKQLYEEMTSLTNWETELGLLPAHLLIGIYTAEPNYAFEKARERLVIYLNHSLFFFGRIEFSVETELRVVIKIIEEIEPKNEENVSHIAYLLSNILKSRFINKTMVEFCFQRFQILFDLEISNSKSIIIDALHWTENYEEQRYDFLMKNHQNFGNLKFIEDYFSNFKDPSYFFDFFQRAYRALGDKMKPELFDSTLYHFIKVSHDKTEMYILDFLSHEELFWRKAGMHLIKTKDIGVHKVNLLRLETEIEQLRALEVLTEYNWNIEAFLPMILLLRNSKFNPVRKELQRVLSKLTFESYHDVLVEKISRLIDNSSDDKKFIKPIKEALGKYHKLVEVKSTIDDLNPAQNERNFMDLFYRLEHENQAKMMDEIKNGKGTFLTSFFKNSVIVRGHSLKVEGRDEVLPLGKIEHSFSIDARAFKNSELFEHQTDNFKSKY